MKFRIRFVDQIVGFFIILALVSLAFVIFMLGKSQRWFADDKSFHTRFGSAAGLSKNMPVLFKGFVIGNVHSFILNEENQVEVTFIIHDEYSDRIKHGSMVELLISPVGLGNQFLFHAGKGLEPLEDGGFIPAAGTEEAREFIRQGLADRPQRDDSISLLLNRASSIMDGLDRVITEVDDALTGTDATAIGRIVGGLNRAVTEVPDKLGRTADSLTSDVNEITAMLERELETINPILENIAVLASDLADPEGAVHAILGADGPVYGSIVDSLGSISGILENLETSSDFIPGQLPELAALITDLRITLKTAEDVLVALTNNPLLRKGVPEKIEPQSSGANPRDIRF